MIVSPVNSVLPAAYATAPATVSSTASPVVAGGDPGLAQQASALSTTSGIVATLGSSSSATAQVYDAAGLYNSIAQAGTSTISNSPATTSDTAQGTSTSAPATAATSAQQPLNSAILSSLPSATVNSGFYNGTGVLQSTSTGNTNLTANWASALQSNPNLSRIVAADSYAQGIIGTLSVTA